MNGLLLEMRFVCCRCEGITTLTVHCTGPGLTAGPRTVAAAEVSCFHCGCHHQVCFRPTGEVVSAEPARSANWCPVPSNN